MADCTCGDTSTSGGLVNKVRAEIDKFSADMENAHQFVQGGENDTVPLGDPDPTPVDTLRNLARQIREALNYWRSKMEELEDPITLDSGIWNIRRSLILTEAVQAGGLLTLPAYYYPTRHILFLMVDNIPFTPKLADNWDDGQRQYQEVGDDPEVLSNQVMVSVDLPVGSYVDVWVISSNLFQAMDEILAAAEQAEQSAADSAASADLSSTYANTSKGYADASESSAENALASANDAAASRDAAATVAQEVATDTATDIIKAMLPGDIGAVAASELRSVLTDANYTGTATTVAVNLSVYNAETQTSSVVQRTFPLAGPDTAGGMPAESFNALSKVISDVDVLKKIGGKQIGVFDTYALLVAWSVPDTVLEGDFAYVRQDENHNNERWSYFYRGADATPKWTEGFFENEAPVGIATSDTFGYVKGVPATAPAGKAFVENDGTISVIGWDDHENRLSNAENALPGKAPANITLTEAAAATALPTTASQTIQEKIQVIRNNLKSLFASIASITGLVNTVQSTAESAVSAAAFAQATADAAEVLAENALPKTANAVSANKWSATRRITINSASATAYADIDGTAPKTIGVSVTTADGTAAETLPPVGASALQPWLIIARNCLEWLVTTVKAVKVTAEAATTPAEVDAKIAAVVGGAVQSADKLTTARNIDGIPFDGQKDVTIPRYGTCATAAGTAAKIGTLALFGIFTGAIVGLKFTAANTAANPTLNVNTTGAKPIFYQGAAIVPGMITAGMTAYFQFNGTQWELINPATQSIKRQTLTANLAANTNYAVPVYKVGAGKLQIYVDGMEGMLGTTVANGLWKEIGTAGAISTTIQFFEVLLAGTQITSVSNI